MSLHLFFLSLKALWHKLYFDVYREIVIFISSFIIISLFLYIFDDFLNTQIATISKPLQNYFTTWIERCLIFILPILCFRHLQKERQDKNHFFALIHHLGVISPRNFRLLRTTFLVTCYFAMGGLVLTLFLDRLENLPILGVLLLLTPLP